MTSIRIVTEQLQGGGCVATAYDDVGQVCEVSAPDKSSAVARCKKKVREVAFDNELEFHTAELR